jgi:hypothetical protein
MAAYDPEARLRYAREQRAKRRAEEEKKQEEEYKRYLEAGGTPKRSWKEEMYVGAEHPNTIDNGTATIWYIIIMVVGAVFNDRLLIWIIATVIWWNHINRKARRQKEWDEKHKNGGNE